MTISADRVSRGLRVEEFQIRLLGEGDTNGPFLRLLIEAAKKFGIPVKWEASRLSKIRSGTQKLSLEDVATFVRIAQMRGIKGEMADWHWFGFGEPIGHDGGVRPTIPAVEASQVEAEVPHRGKRRGSGAHRKQA